MRSKGIGDRILCLRKICLQKLTRSGYLLGVLLLKCKQKVLMRENLQVLPKREQTWIVRIGDRAVHRFGGRSLKKLI